MAIYSFESLSIYEGNFCRIYTDHWTVLFMNLENIDIPSSSPIAPILPQTRASRKKWSWNFGERMEVKSIYDDSNESEGID